MVAAARSAAPARPLGLAALEGDTVGRLARWLLLAVALDLVVTRFIVRLAMFVPKGEPWASVGAVLGRVGAAADALVPIVGVLLLGALLLRSGRAGGRLEPAILLGIGAVAAGGLALVVLPPTPTPVRALDALVACLALAAGIRALRVGKRLPRLALAGLASLAAALALAAGARLVGAVGGGASGLAVDALGQLAFVAGAGLVGAAGVADLLRSAVADRRVGARWLAAGGLVALVVLAAGAGAPQMWGSLAIWSVGLTGVVPTPLVALAAGLAVAGLPALHGRAPAAAIGASVVLLAGYGLAASGLVLAGLLGLVVAGSAGEREREWRAT